MAFTNKPLPYAYNALEPYFDEKTMTIHHTKHHEAYINNLNAALDKEPAFKDKSLHWLLTNLNQLPVSIKGAVQNNGGGHFNHSFFWEILKVNKGSGPKGALLDALVATFGSVEDFKIAFSNAAKTRFGSGWAWLILTHDKKLKVLSTPNQDTPLLEGTPLIGLDVWEHAYYLNYQNRRPDYVDAFWHVLNWDLVSDNYDKLVK